MILKETPILFTGHLLPMTLDGRKTETRRVPRKLPKWADPVCTSTIEEGRLMHWNHFKQERQEIPCPYGKAGDLLHCGEVLEPVMSGKGMTRGPAIKLARYARDKVVVNDALGFPVKWRWKVKKLTSMYTPKAYRRIWFEVVETRAERLQDITVSSMLREGLQLPSGVEPAVAVEAWTALWDSINAKRGYPCADDPIVWVVRFKSTEGGGR